ncbi:MAG: hypothetical protein NC931_03245 [Candidatus Omnitrophica bacterium]|nr:hypothetical protein [Candidatus Omnitrophota bacterium]
MKNKKCIMCDTGNLKTAGGFIFSINYAYQEGHPSGSYAGYRHGVRITKTCGTKTAPASMANVLFVNGHIESKTTEALCSSYPVVNLYR